jgi:hypothetical protein
MGLGKLKNKLGVTNMASDQRSKLFKEFRYSGGKVLDEKNLSFAEYEDDHLQELINLLDIKEQEGNLTALERRRLSSARRVQQQRKKGSMYTYRGPTDEKTADSEQTDESKKAVPRGERRDSYRIPYYIHAESGPKKWFQLFWSRVRCILNGIFPIFKIRVKNRFLNYIGDNIRHSLRVNKQILASILYQDKELSQEIKETFRRSGFYNYYELIYRFDNLLDDDLFDEVLGLKKLGKAQIKDAHLVLTKLYKKLFSIKQYVSFLKDALNRAMGIESRMRNLRPDIVTGNLRTIIKHIDSIFVYLYKKLGLLVDFFYLNRVKSGWQHSFLQFIGFITEDHVGYLTKMWDERDEYERKRKQLAEVIQGKVDSATKVKEQNTKNNIDLSEGLTDAIRDGLNFMYDHIDFFRVLEKGRSNPSDDFSYFHLRDKVFVINTLVDFFDKEYSFLFLSNRVTYNVFFDGTGRKVDVRNSLRDLYYKINLIYQRVREYLAAVRQLKNMLNVERPTQVELSVEYKNIMHQKTNMMRTIHQTTTKIFSQFEKIMFYILSDARGQKMVLQNPDDEVKIGSKVADINIFKGLRFIDVFQSSYNYTAALNYLLNEGELDMVSLNVDEPYYLHLVNTAEIEQKITLEEEQKAREEEEKAKLAETENEAGEKPEGETADSSEPASEKESDKTSKPVDMGKPVIPKSSLAEMDDTISSSVKEDDRWEEEIRKDIDLMKKV